MSFLTIFVIIIGFIVSFMLGVYWGSEQIKYRALAYMTHFLNFLSEEVGLEEATRISDKWSRKQEREAKKS